MLPKTLVPTFPIYGRSRLEAIRSPRVDEFCSGHQPRCVANVLRWVWRPDLDSQPGQPVLRQPHSNFPCPRPSMETARLLWPVWAVWAAGSLMNFIWISLYFFRRLGKWMHWWQRCWLLFSFVFVKSFCCKSKARIQRFFDRVGNWRHRFQNFPFPFFFAVIQEFEYHKVCGCCSCYCHCKATLAATARSWLTVGTQCSVRQPRLSNPASFPHKDSTPLQVHLDDGGSRI